MINSYVHAFGGVFGQTDDINEKFLSQQRILFDKTDFKLFLPHEVPEVCYKLNESSFLWTGGSKTIASLEDFNYEKDSSKFVYVTRENSGYSVYTDHYSKIPLLYFKKNATIYFASSLRYLISICKSHAVEIDFEGVLLFYNFGINSFETGLIKDVKVLPGGSKLTHSKKGILISKYFDISNLETNWSNKNSDDANTKLIDDYLLKSTTRTVNSYNNVGIALSGGLDSGYLAQKINEAGKVFNAYTLGYEGGYNEFERIDYLSKQLNFKANKIIIDDKDIVDNFVDMNEFASFPLEYNNTILNFIYKQAAEDKVEVMFDGDGADRLFLGMNKYLQLKKFLNFYATTKKIKVNTLLQGLLGLVNHPSANKLLFYLKKFNLEIPFYGERRLSNSVQFDAKFEKKLNDLILPEELKGLGENMDEWLFFTLFSLYYTPTFFFHSPYEIQLKHNIVSNPEFWSDDMVKLALSIPVEAKLHKKTTKKILREAAKTKIDDGYWNLKKIGLQNSFGYIKSKPYGKDFINSYVNLIKKTDEYQYLVENTPDKSVDPSRLLPYYIWKEKMMASV